MSRTGTGDKGQETGNCGFTLVEICIVAVIFVVLSAGLITTFLTGRTSYLSADAYVQVQQESRRAFDAMVRELREAGPSNEITVAADGAGTAARRLNFKIARGYNIDAVACPNAICWGNDTINGGWVHYTVITASGVRQLIRFTSNENERDKAAPATCSGATSCRVLANYVPATGSFFSYDAPTKAVTVTLQIIYANPVLPTGSMTGPALTARVTLRN